MNLISSLENPLKCDCEMKWYKTWYETVNDTDHMKDITCSGQDGEEHLMKNVSLEEMYCTDLDPDQPDYSNMTASSSLVYSLRQDVLTMVFLFIEYIFQFLVQRKHHPRYRLLRVRQTVKCDTKILLMEINRNFLKLPDQT